MGIPLYTICKSKKVDLCTYVNTSISDSLKHRFSCYEPFWCFALYSSSDSHIDPAVFGPFKIPLLRKPVFDFRFVDFGRGMNTCIVNVATRRFVMPFDTRQKRQYLIFESTFKTNYPI